MRRFDLNTLNAPALCLVLVLGTCSAVWSDTAFSTAVQRSTNDRDADLVRALIDAARFDDALSLCLSQSRGADPEDDRVAKWAIRQSEVLTARQMARDQFGDSELEAVQTPVRTLLSAYPQHRRSRFLESQLLASQRQSAYHAVLRAAVSPADDGAREMAARKLLTAMSDVLALVDQVRDARALLDTQRNSENLPLISDLVRLAQTLQVDAVSLALVQTELFDEGGADRIAAATKAEQAADDAIARLPFGTQARKEVERLKVEAIFRAQQIDRADQAFKTLARTFGEPMPPKLLSLLVRIRLAQGQTDQAGQLLQQFYGDVPESAPRAEEMDLARLEYLLRRNEPDAVGNWLDAILRRGGAYARRMAEAVSLARLRAGRDNDGSPAMDPSLIAAQGQDWLRRGDPARAADLLAAAAAAERNPDRAMTRAGEAAAAFLAAERYADAAGVLADISVANPSGKNAGATHLQAIVMLSKFAGQQPDAAKQIETLLQANLKLWPGEDVAVSVRGWLQKLLRSQGRYVDAAKVASNIPIENIDSQAAQAIAEAWIDAIDQAPETASSERRELRRAFQAALQPLLANELMLDQYRTISGLYLDRQALSNLPGPGANETAKDQFITQLIDHRNSGIPLTQLPPPEWKARVAQRLMADGREYPNLRPAIAKTLASWEGGSDASLAAAERLLWSRNIDQAITMLRKLRAESVDSASVSRDSALLLAATGDANAKREAIRIFDEFASGMKQGSKTWHEAKLAGIRLLREVGDGAEAFRRAKFIRLTQTQMSEEWKRQYDSVPNP